MRPWARERSLIITTEIDNPELVVEKLNREKASNFLSSALARRFVRAPVFQRPEGHDRLGERVQLWRAKTVRLDKEYPGYETTPGGQQDPRPKDHEGCNSGTGLQRYSRGLCQSRLLSFLSRRSGGRGPPSGGRASCRPRKHTTTRSAPHGKQYVDRWRGIDSGFRTQCMVFRAREIRVLCVGLQIEGSDLARYSHEEVARPSKSA